MQSIRKRLKVAAASLLCIIAPLRAQAPSRQPVPTVSFRYEKPSRDSGDQTPRLLVHVEIDSGWHINSDAPLDDFLVPTRVESKAEGMAFGKPVYPRPERVHSDALGSDMLLFSGGFDVDVPVLRKTAPGPGKAGGDRNNPRTRVVLKYQACDHATCFPPKEVSVEH